MTLLGLPLVFSASTVLALVISQAEDRGSRLRAFLGLLLGIICLSPLLLLVQFAAK